VPKFANIPEDKKKEIKTDDLNTINLMIEGDNYHSLAVLNFTHLSPSEMIKYAPLIYVLPYAPYLTLDVIIKIP